MTTPRNVRTERAVHGDPVTTPHDFSRLAVGGLDGRTVRLAPVRPAADVTALYACSHGIAAEAALWRFMPYGPFDDEAAMERWLEGCAGSEDPRFYVIRVADDDRALGMCSYLDIEAAHATIEMAHIWYAPPLQRTVAATEAMWLMLEHAFDTLGARRVQWKCDALNAPSRAAAVRLGFRFEGILYRHRITKGLNRDSAYFSLLAEEWPTMRTRFTRWLDASNFDETGRQRSALNMT